MFRTAVAASFTESERGSLSILRGHLHWKSSQLHN